MDNILSEDDVGLLLHEGRLGRGDSIGWYSTALWRESLLITYAGQYKIFVIDTCNKNEIVLTINLYKKESGDYVKFETKYNFNQLVAIKLLIKLGIVE